MAVNIKTLVFIVCLPYLLDNIIRNGMISTTVSSIQARYSLSSLNVGVIFGMLDVGSSIMLAVVIIIGENVNKPKWLFVNSIILATGSIIFAIPHFTAPPYVLEKNETIFNHCGNVTNVECMENALTVYMIVFMIGAFFMGVGGSAIYTYGITYIDDNTTSNQSSLYTSIFYTMAAWGPAIGFGTGGALTELFVNPFENVDISSSHLFWIGAWWPGYVFFGACSLLVSFCFFVMPSKIANEEPKPLASFRKRSQKLLTNPLFTMTILVAPLVSAFTVGFNTFGVKYSQSQFGLTTFMATVLYGVTAVISCSLGHLGSGFIMSRFKMEMTEIIKFCIVISFVSMVCTFGFFFYCKDDVFAGATRHYTGTLNSSEITLVSKCNDHCGCSTDMFNPVRGADNVVYYSPCYAGCKKARENGSYDDCACVNYNNDNATYTANEVSTISGEHCPMMVGFAIITGLAICTSVMVISPSTQIALRSVHITERSSAVAIRRLAANLLGILPARVLSGKILDAVCLLWSTKCGERSSCQVYQKWNMAIYMFLMLQIEAFFVFILFIIIYYVHKSQRGSHQ